MSEHEQATAEAVAYYNGKWPKHLTSGVMFWKGERITYLEFMRLANKTKGWVKP